jgi:hypothetical protein
MPIVYTSPPEEFEDPTYSDDNQNVIQLRHRMANGAINNHTNPKGDMIGKDMFLNLLQSKMQSGERLGFCWLPTCSAKLYPQEVLSILQQSKYEDESEKAEDMKVYARYNELFAMKFCVAQLGGRKTRRKSRASRKTRR